MKRYLELVPDAPNAKATREKLYLWEMKAKERGPIDELGRDGRFIAYENGTVLDTVTNLMWVARDSDEDIDWYNAKSYCDNYRGGGYTDWRLPTQSELKGLYDKSKSYMASQATYNIHVTEMIKLSRCCPWAADREGLWCYTIDFDTGEFVGLYRPYKPLTKVLPVRSAK
jgi:hypothetical protein